MCIPIYPLLDFIFWLLEQCCYKHLHDGMFLFHIIRVYHWGTYPVIELLHPTAGLFLIKNAHTVCHSGTIIYILIYSKNSSFSTSSPAFVAPSVLHNSHSDRVRQSLIMVLICISLLTNDNDHLFMCLLVIYVCIF